MVELSRVRVFKYSSIQVFEFLRYRVFGISRVHNTERKGIKDLKDGRLKSTLFIRKFFLLSTEFNIKTVSQFQYQNCLTTFLGTLFECQGFAHAH